MTVSFSDYHKMSIAELVGLIARLDIIIEEKRKEQRTELLRELRKMAEDHGYQLSDLIAGVRLKTTNSSTIIKFDSDQPDQTPAQTADQAQPPAQADDAVRDPTTGKTWSGRGRKPSWLKADAALEGLD